MYLLSAMILTLSLNLEYLNSAISCSECWFPCWQPWEADWQHSLHSRRGREHSESFRSSSGSDKNSLSLPCSIWFWHSFQPRRISREWVLVFILGAVFPLFLPIAAFSHLCTWNQFLKVWLGSQKLLQNHASSTGLIFLETSKTLWHLLSPFFTAQALISRTDLMQELWWHSN